MSKRKQDRAHYQNRGDFDDRGPILQVRAFSRAEDIYDRHHQDHRDGSQLGDQWRERDNLTEVTAKGDRERGHGAAANHEEKCPAVQESRQTPETIADEDVQTTCFRIHRAQLPIG